MTRFTTGIVAGGIMTALGVAYAVADQRTKNKMMHNGRKMAKKAERAVSHAMDDMF